MVSWYNHQGFESAVLNSSHYKWWKNHNSQPGIPDLRIYVSAGNLMGLESWQGGCGQMVRRHSSTLLRLFAAFGFKEMDLWQLSAAQLTFALDGWHLQGLGMTWEAMIGINMICNSQLNE
jgi:hypothetical protein